MELDSHDKRRHVRCTVYEPCSVLGAISDHELLAVTVSPKQTERCR